MISDLNLELYVCCGKMADSLYRGEIAFTYCKGASFSKKGETITTCPHCGVDITRNNLDASLLFYNEETCCEDGYSDMVD